MSFATMSDKAVRLVKNYAQLLGVAGALVLLGSIYQEHKTTVKDLSDIKIIITENTHRLVRMETLMRLDSADRIARDNK